MNKFYKSASLAVKILALVILAWLFAGSLFSSGEDNIQLGFTLFVLIFILLPTIFIFFFKKDFLAKHEKFAKLWKILRIIYAIVLILFIVVIILGLYKFYEVKTSQKVIDYINSQKITLGDVMGNNLPPVPDQKLNDSTIAGIDANKNNIRDDVELAIFNKYPNSAKMRAAELQYAQALQLELTQVFNSETFVATIKKENLAYGCMSKSDLNSPLSVIDQREEEVENFVLNTDLRIKEQSDNYKKYMTSYSLPSGDKCDINILSLPN
jgi:amino acid transporter